MGGGGVHLERLQGPHLIRDLLSIHEVALCVRRDIVNQIMVIIIILLLNN